MPEGGRIIVTNTTPLIALAVATDSLDILRALYDRVIVPLEVSEEIRTASTGSGGVPQSLLA